MKKTSLTIGTILTTAAPFVAVVSCSNPPKKKLGDTGVTVSYWPDLDPMLALGVKIESAPIQRDTGSFAPWIPKDTKYYEEFKNIRISKPIWDFSTLDEEYFRNLNGKGKPVGITYQKWLTTEQKQFLNEDPNIIPIATDFNEGIPHEKYHWAVKDENEYTHEVLFQNETNKNYDVMGNLWQIRDMGAVLKKAASSLDEVYGTDKYSQKASTIIETTNTHWDHFRELQEQSNTKLKAYTNKQLQNRNLDLTSKHIENPKTGTSKDDENLLIIEIKTGGVEASLQKSMRVASISSHKELYTKTHFSMPEITSSQFNRLKKGTNIKDDGHAIMGGISNASINFPQPSKQPFTDDFWSDWYGKIDKLVVSMSYKELNNGQDFYNKFNSDTGIDSIGVTLKKLLKDDVLKPTNTIFEQDLLASGTRAMAFRMPIGQNAFIDHISTSFYGDTKGFNWEERI